MGSDIHLYIEARMQLEGEHRWVHVQPAMVVDMPSLSRWHPDTLNYEGEFVEDLPLEQLQVKMHFPQGHMIGINPYPGRNYDEFGMLAGVRSGYDPICEPRGVPDDLSPQVQEEVDSWGIDAHSHGWLDLSDLTNEQYWSKRTDTISETVHDDVLHQIETTAIGGVQVEMLDPSLQINKNYKRVSYTTTYARLSHWVYPVLIPQLQGFRYILGRFDESHKEFQHLDDQDIRIVFFFDS